MNLETYEKCFVNQEKCEVTSENIMGKITRGKIPKDFQTLTHERDRKIVMLMGADGLESLLGKSGQDLLVEIGYTQDHIDHLISEGYKFKLVIFEPSQSCLLATWDNAAQLASEIYPKVKQKIYQKLDDIKKTPFSEIEKESGLNWGKIDKIGDNDPNFMTYNRFKRSKGSLSDVRAFFYFTLHFRELFSGDGYIINQREKKR